MVDGKGEKPADKSKWAKEMKEQAEQKVEAAVKAKPREQHLPGMEPKKRAARSKPCAHRHWKIWDSDSPSSAPLNLPRHASTLI